jgi:hypothetical protein
MNLHLDDLLAIEAEAAAPEHARADKAEAALAEARVREKAAYLALVSVQPAAHRATMQSPNDTALRLNIVLEDAIQAWVNDYLAARDEATL